jgi:DNA polymerase-1
LNGVLYLIDGHYQIFRGFFGMRPLTNGQGMQVQAVYAVTDLLLRLKRQYGVERWAIAMDASGPTFRHERYPEYKGTREEMPPELVAQLPWIDRVIEAFRIPILSTPGLEADDWIASASVHAAAAGLDVRILSKDKDLEQVLSERIQILDERDGDLRDPAWLLAKKGIRPDQVVQYQALVGDTSDNVPGVSGIGAKGAAKILSVVEDIEQLLEDPIPEGITPRNAKLIREQVESLRLSRWLVELRTDLELPTPVETLRVEEPDVPALLELFQELGFRRFREQLLKEQGEGPEVESGLLPGMETSPAVAPAAPPGSYTLVESLEQLDQVVEACRGAGRFAFDTETTGLDPLSDRAVGVSLAWTSGEAVYVPLESPGRGALPRGDVLERLRPILEDPELGKIAQNSKYDAQIMANDGVHLRGIAFDPMLAAYLLNPLHGRYKLDDMVGERLNHRMIPIADIIGRGEDEVSMADLAPEAIRDYAAEDADFTLRLAEVLEKEVAEQQLERVLTGIECPLVEVLVDMEREGITLDVGRLTEQQSELEVEVAALEAAIHDAAGEEFKISSPKQLQTILFDKLGLPVIQKTKTGRSTNAEVLEELSVQVPDQPLPGLILEHRSLSKLLNTYITALPKLVHPDTGRLHTDFRQTVAATGRLSSEKPNLQNIPIRNEVGRRIRRAFRPNRPGHLFLSADYSQIELRLLAHISGDETLVRTLRDGEDIHATVAARIHGKEVAEVSREERSAAKAVNFGVIYGMGAFGLARDLKIPVAEAKEFIEAFFSQFPGVRRFIEETKESARESGEVRTLYGRRRPIPEIQSRLPRDRARGERFAVNSVVQGSAADVIKMAMVDIHRSIRERGSEARLLLQIHDELLLEVPEAALDAEREHLVHCMQEVVSLEVPLLVSASSGSDWYDASK